MSSLSDREIAEAAAEAGISPAELRAALAQKEGNLPARVAAQTGALRPSARGAVDSFAEARIPAAPRPAVLHVRSQLERIGAMRGHMQGEVEADIVDEKRGVVYRLRGEDDGAHGAMVRIDVDASQARARQTFATLSLAAAVSFIGLGALLLASTPTAIVLMICAAAVALPLQIRTRIKTRQSLADATSLARQAILDAEDREILAIPARSPDAKP